MPRLTVSRFVREQTIITVPPSTTPRIIRVCVSELKSAGIIRQRFEADADVRIDRESVAVSRAIDSARAMRAAAPADDPKPAA